MLTALISAILASGNTLVLDGSFVEQLRPFVDPDSMEAKSPENLVADLPKRPGMRVLDFGCGTGSYRGFLEAQGFDWYGLNYRDGMAPPAAAAATAKGDDRFIFYDGMTVPFGSNTFDLVFSFQVFEHIQSIETTFAELHRVLRPGGALIGAVSYLEQIHDFSTYNFTPYGLKLAAERAGLRLERIYPRADVFSFLLHRLLVVSSGVDEDSLHPVLRADSEISSMIGHYAAGLTDIASGNLLQIMFAAHIAFKITKPLEA